MRITIHRAHKRDLRRIAELDQYSFTGNHNVPDAMRWIESRMHDPVFRIWIAKLDGVFGGFVTWQIQGGFNRERPVTELERLAVVEELRGKKIAQHLVEDTLPLVGRWVRDTNKLTRHASQSTIVVWAGVDNPVNHIYRKYFPEVGGFQYRYSKPENLLRGTLVLP
jgi:hypothetical protein